MSVGTFENFVASKSVDLKAATPEQLASLHGQYSDAKIEEHKSDLENRLADKDSLQAVKEAAQKHADEANKMTREQLKKMAEDFEKRLSENVNEKGGLKGIKKEMAKKLDSTIESVKALKDSEKAGFISTKLSKAEEIILRSGNGGLSTKATVEAGSIVNNQDAHEIDSIGQLAFRMLTLYDAFPKLPVDANSNGVVRYSDWRPVGGGGTDTVRGAATVAEGAAFPASTAFWQTYTEALQKVGDSIKVTHESMRYRQRFVAELNRFLGTNVDLQVDQQLYDGDGTGTNLNGVYTRANTYAPVASGIQDANIFDLIRKVRSNITKGKRSKYMPNIAMMNVDTIDDMLLKKDADNNYVRPDFLSLGQDLNVIIVSGVAIIETNVVADNTFLLGDRRFASIYEEEGLSIETGFSADDFERDLMTMKARRMLCMLVREIDVDAWRKVTDITTALSTLATP